MTAQDYRAGAALGHSAAELGATETNLITQSEQEWRFRIEIQSVGTTIHLEGNLGHARLNIILRPGGDFLVGARCPAARVRPLL